MKLTRRLWQPCKSGHSGDPLSETTISAFLKLEVPRREVCREDPEAGVAAAGENRVLCALCCGKARLAVFEVGSEVVVCSHEEGMTLELCCRYGCTGCTCLHSGKESYRVDFEAGRGGEGAEGKAEEFG